MKGSAEILNSLLLSYSHLLDSHALSSAIMSTVVSLFSNPSAVPL